MAPRSPGGVRPGGVRGRARGAGRADDDPPDGAGDRRAEGRGEGGRVEGLALALSGLLVGGRSAWGARGGCVDLGLVVSGGGRTPWLGFTDRRSRVGRLGSRSPADGAVTRPPPVLTRGTSTRPGMSGLRTSVGGGATGGNATRPLPAPRPVLGRPATGGGSVPGRWRTTVIGVPDSPAARSLNPKRGRVGLRGPTITTRSARYR